MNTFVGIGAAFLGIPTAAISTDGVIVWGLLLFLIGLIAWSKYVEPPLSDPYPAAAGRPPGVPAVEPTGRAGPAEHPDSKTG